MKFQKIHFAGAPEVPALGVNILPESIMKPRHFNAYLGNIYYVWLLNFLIKIFLLGQSLASFANSKHDGGQYSWFSKMEPAPKLVVDNVLIGDFDSMSLHIMCEYLI